MIKMANTYNSGYVWSTYCVPASAKHFTYIISMIFEGSFAQRDFAIFAFNNLILWKSIFLYKHFPVDLGFKKQMGKY